MRVALIGTRGVPARYGGFETAIEEVGQRLAGRGHDVVVYCRRAVAPRPRDYLGMDLVHLPAARIKSLETLSHSALSIAHACSRRERFDAAVVFNSANSPFLPVLRLRRIPAALHVDGIEWRRTKWRGSGRAYYRLAESLGVRWADALIADAKGIADYYDTEFAVPTELLTYGALIQDVPATDRLDDLNLRPREFHVAVARFEPENHILEMVNGYVQSNAEMPLLVVGSAPYADEYTEKIFSAAAGDSRVRFLGAVWDQEQLDQLYANSLTYLHGHSVGGTNPSLLRAMGGGSAVLAWDVVFNREVLGRDGRFFDTPRRLGHLLEEAESSPSATLDTGAALRDRAARKYRWDDVAAGYENLLFKLFNGESIRGKANGRRRSSPHVGG